MPDQLDADYCRREAKRMRAKAETEKNPVLRDEFQKVAQHFELLASEIETVQRRVRNGG